MHYENNVLGIRQLRSEPDINMNQKSKYAFIHIWPLFGCISAFFLYNRTKLVWSFAFGVHNGGERASSFVALDL